MTEPGDLAVVIPTRARPAILARTLDALARQTVTGFEVIVVVDGDDQPVPRRRPVRVLVQAHAGPGAARNLGAATTDRRLVLFLGDDMIPTPTLVEAHLRAQARHPEPTSAVLGTVQWHPGVIRNRIVRWLDRSRSQFDFPADGDDEAGWGRFYSCNASLDRCWFLDAGGFDAAFPFDYEDLDCGLRLAEHGMRLWYEPTAVVHHLHAQTWGGLLRRYASKAVGERRFCAKHPSVAPFFASRVEEAAVMPPVPDWAAFVADRFADRDVPGAGRAADLVDRWFHQRVGVTFLAAWDAEEDRDAGWAAPPLGPPRSAAVLASLTAAVLQPGDRVWVAGGGPPSLVRRLDGLGAKVVTAEPADVVVVPDVDAVAPGGRGPLEAGARHVVAGASWAAADDVLARARRQGIRRWHRGDDGVAVCYAGGRGVRTRLGVPAPLPMRVSG